ncbi:MAG: hypothetical protein EAY75_04950 [Bacteroidetes bacterium]|nr:MAG: hypothetical protein EAY75_04950 [Bacteroidota bacterium]
MVNLWPAIRLSASYAQLIKTFFGRRATGPKKGKTHFTIGFIYANLWWLLKPSNCVTCST